MSKINIELEQDYKQFKTGFKTELNGNLIILTGVNGSGKTQLIDILSQSQFNPNNINYHDIEKYHIDSKIKINDNDINKTEITRRSFKENISVYNIGNSTPKNSLWDKEEAWNYFSDCNRWGRSTVEYSKAKSIIQRVLEENEFPINCSFNSGKPNNTETYISKEKFIQILPDDFIWETDDLFANRISELFYEFAAKRQDYKAKLGEGSGGFNNDDYIKKAPWTILNNLFEKLNLSYRFKKDFEFETPNLKERPMLFPIKSDGKIDFDSPREVSDLSDGEKSIISLVFALINETRRPIEKLLLLDEFDNTLNPSLIEGLYTVLEEYFIKNGVTVIITTHSPVTISLAPDYATYYEMFKQDNDSPKILEVDKNQYSELKVANKKFFDSYSNLELRQKELEGENDKLKEKIETLTMPLIITEGKTDWKHLKKAKNKLDNKLEFSFFEYEEDMGDSALLNMLKEQVRIDNSNKRIFIFDNDNDKITKDVMDENCNYKDWGNNVFSFAIPQPGIRQDESKISIEHYYPDEILKKEHKYPDGVIRRLYCGNDFQKTGINTDLNKRCNKKGQCGKDKIRVLSGTGEEKVFDLDNDDNDFTNYAMTKDEFFENIINSSENEIDMNKFNLIFDIIKEIINS